MKLFKSIKRIYKEFSGFVPLELYPDAKEAPIIDEGGRYKKVYYERNHKLYCRIHYFEKKQIHVFLWESDQKYWTFTKIITP